MSTSDWHCVADNMATTRFHTTRSEEEIGEKVDKCLTDGLIKAGITIK